MLALAALLVVSFTIPAWAMENQFGGYFRFRGWTSQNFSGRDEYYVADPGAAPVAPSDYATDAMKASYAIDKAAYDIQEAAYDAEMNKDVSAVDVRARLYYTAIFHENLKFVSRFEMDTAYGSDSDKGTGGWGDIGADGVNLEIKQAYADFNLGPVNFKVGAQGAELARGFLFSDDFSGIVMTFKGGSFAIPLIWMKAWEGGMGEDANDFDVDYYGIAPSFNIGDNIKINPFGLYAYSDDASGWTQVKALSNTEELKLWYAGMNFDANFNAFSLWATGIYQGGDMELKSGASQDFSAWLAAAGFGLDMNWGGIHSQFFYATGEDANDPDWEKFWVPRGQSYYWAEIMGYGILGDNYYANTSRNACADQIGDIMAANFGVTIKPVDKLKISFDVWYAALAEDITVNGSDENYLGTEVDMVITYQLVQGLNLDIVGAYMFAGDATTLDHPDDANPYEVGTRLSLAF